MEVIIERFKISHLRNMEYALIVPRILRIADSYDPERLHLGRRLNRAKAFLPELQRIEAIERKWHKSRQLGDSEFTRDIMVNTIIQMVRAFMRINIPVKSKAAELLDTLFDKHGRDIAVDSDTAETQRIFNLVKDVEASAELREAMNVLGLAEVFDYMKSANIEFNDLWEERNRELGQKEPVNTKAVRQKCNKALTALFDAIEHNSAEYEELDYLPLAKELNKQAAFYRQQLKARATRRKNNEKDKGEDIKPLDE